MPVIPILRPRFSSLLLVCHSAYARAQLATSNSMALDSLPYLFILCPASISRALAAARHSFALSSRVAALSSLAVLAYLLSALLRTSAPLFVDDVPDGPVMKSPDVTSGPQTGVPPSPTTVPTHIGSIDKLPSHSEHNPSISISSPFPFPGGLSSVVAQSAYRYSYYTIRPLLSALLVGRSTDSLVVKCLHHADRVLVLPAPNATLSKPVLLSAPSPRGALDHQVQTPSALSPSDTDATLVDTDEGGPNSGKEKAKEKNDHDAHVAVPGLPDTSPSSKKTRSFPFLPNFVFSFWRAGRESREGQGDESGEY